MKMTLIPGGVFLFYKSSKIHFVDLSMCSSNKDLDEDSL